MFVGPCGVVPMQAGDLLLHDELAAKVVMAAE